MSSNFYVGGVSAPNQLDSLYVTNSAAGWANPSTGFTKVVGVASTCTGYGQVFSVFVPFQSGNVWKDISTIGIGAAGVFATAAVKNDGSLWTVGANTYGQLGLGDITARTFFARVGTLNDWSYVSFKANHVLALKNNGTLWAWGYNSGGPLGLGDLTPRSSPVQIGSLTDWAMVSAGATESYAIKADRTLWAWGQNTVGQLGDGTTTGRSSPVQIGLLTNWATISAGSSSAAALKTDGTLWTWGANASGQLGDGTIVNKSSPVQVGSGTDWIQAVMANTTLLAVKSDNTLWSCGLGGSTGVQGRNGAANASSPVQVGVLTDWSAIYSNGNAVIATKTDGTLWGWCATGVYCGDGTIIPKSSPVQIGSLNGWAPPISAGTGAGFLTYKPLLN
jgi:alpha-tubulin suppressor-like RCC1 family protein